MAYPGYVKGTMTGGKSRLDVFWVSRNTAGTDYDYNDPAAIWAAAGDTTDIEAAILAPTALGTPARAGATVYRAEMINETKISRKKAVLDIELVNWEDSEWIENLLIYPFGTSDTQATADQKTEYLEDGTPYIIGGNETRLLLLISYGASSSDGSKVKVTIDLVQLEESSGSWTQKYGENSNPTLKFTGITTRSTLTIPAALFNDTFVVGAEQVMKSGLGHMVVFMTAA